MAPLFRIYNRDNPVSSLSDEELMARYQEGEEAAFEEIYARYGRKIYGFLVRRLGQSEEQKKGSPMQGMMQEMMKGEQSGKGSMEGMGDMGGMMRMMKMMEQCAAMMEKCCPMAEPGKTDKGQDK